MTEDIPDLKYCSYKVFVHWRMYYETNRKLCSGAVLLGEVSAPHMLFQFLTVVELSRLVLDPRLIFTAQAS